jgi:hypothetical protein
MKINEYRNGIFGVPNGECRLETPDGITLVNQANESNNNLVNSMYVTTDGHALGRGYGPMRDDDDEGTRISALDCD